MLQRQEAGHPDGGGSSRGRGGLSAWGMSTPGVRAPQTRRCSGGSPSRSCLCECRGVWGPGVGKVRALGVSRQVAWVVEASPGLPALEPGRHPGPERGQVRLGFR